MIAIVVGGLIMGAIVAVIIAVLAFMIAYFMFKKDKEKLQIPPNIIYT